MLIKRYSKKLENFRVTHTDAGTVLFAGLELSDPLTGKYAKRLEVLNTVRVAVSNVANACFYSGLCMLHIASASTIDQGSFAVGGSLLTIGLLFLGAMVAFLGIGPALVGIFNAIADCKNEKLATMVRTLSSAASVFGGIGCAFWLIGYLLRRW